MKWYVGSRWKEGCYPDESFDVYPSSSKYAKSDIKANPQDWTKEIIAVGTKEEVYQLETDILELFDAKNDSRSFNAHNNTLKHFDKTGVKESDYTRTKKSLFHTGRKRPDHAKTISEKWKSGAFDRLKGKGSRPRFDGNAKSYVITKPDGSMIEIKNLAKFARDNNYPLPTMKDILKSGYAGKKGKLLGFRIVKK
jgi:hypothetical protein